MRADPINERHVSSESFGRYLDSQVPVLLPIRGAPDAAIFIDPSKPELGLRVEVGSAAAAPPETGLRNIVSRSAQCDGRRFVEVVVTLPSLFRDAYPVLCSMVDRTQIDSMSPADALRATLNKMVTLLRAPDSMSHEREVGLYGELLVLRGLIGTLGAAKAVESWRGGLGEEHDFGLPTVDVEVKTTTSERRLHWIESSTQLVSTGGRQLWLISHQLTAAGTGAGHTLPDLIEAVSDEIDAPIARDRFEKALAASGWLDANSAEPASRWTRWTRRTGSLAYLVAGDFPRLTPDALRVSDISLERVPDIRYRINLEGFDSATDCPREVAGVIQSEGLA